MYHNRPIVADIRAMKARGNVSEVAAVHDINLEIQKGGACEKLLNSALHFNELRVVK